MSLAGHPSDDQLDAATWCGQLIPAGSVHAFLAEHRHELFPPELFADVARQGGGHRSVPAEVIATVMVLQALEGLSDREAISALRRDIAWKVACGLGLDDEGCIPGCWWTGATASARRRGPGGSSRRSVRSWSRPGCSPDAAGGCWTPPSWPVRSPPRTPSPSWSRRSAGSAGWWLWPVRSSWPPTTTTVQASQCAPGTTPTPSRRWCRGWSTTRWRCWRWSPTWSWRPSRLRRSRCWRWSPAKTSSQASGQEAGGSPARSPPTG
jgi:hypothetical protein